MGDNPGSVLVISIATVLERDHKTASYSSKVLKTYALTKVPHCGDFSLEDEAPMHNRSVYEAATVFYHISNPSLAKHNLIMQWIEWHLQCTFVNT